MDWVPGRDVSHHDGTPDLTEYDFVIIRIGDDGNDAMPSDRKFWRNLEVARQNGVPYGFYNFTRDNRDPLVQADRLGAFVASLPDAPPLGLWADFESDSGKVPIHPDGFPQWIDDYLARLDAVTGMTVGIYGGEEFIDDWFHAGVHAHRRLWLARYPKLGDPGPVDRWPAWADWHHGPAIPHTWSSYVMWQFAAPDSGAAFDMNLADPDWLASCLEEDVPPYIAHDSTGQAWKLDGMCRKLLTDVQADKLRFIGTKDIGPMDDDVLATCSILP